MKQSKPFAITISRQLGCGGSEIGQTLADKMGIFYADREIIRSAAKELSVLEEDIDFRDEKVPSFWQALFENNSFAPDINVIWNEMPPTDRELFEAEVGVIRHIAEEKSAVIMGRCGFDVLRDHPNTISVYLYADNTFRSERIQKQFQITPQEAEKMLQKNDKERALYCKSYTGKEWSVANNYDLCINTGKTGFDNVVEVILNYLKINGMI